MMKILKRIRKHKKLIMTLLVRDEVDIIEYNINFHLANGVDFIIATDNGSKDGTKEVLEKYQEQGVLLLIEEQDNDYAQAEWVNRMGKIAYEKYAADMVFHCDADEFWFSKKKNLKAELSNRKDIDALSVELVNVLLEDKKGTEKFPDDSRYAVIEPQNTDDLEGDSLNKNLYLFRYPPKVFFKTTKGPLSVTQGNHAIENKDIVITKSNDITIYHFPVRSKIHFFLKVKNGGEAYNNNKKLGKKVGWHWKRWFSAYSRGELNEKYRELLLAKEEADILLQSGEIEFFSFKELYKK